MCYLDENTELSSFQTTSLCQMICCFSHSVNTMSIENVYNTKIACGQKLMWENEAHKNSRKHKVSMFPGSIK